MKLYFALAALLMPALGHATGVENRRADLLFSTDCKTITNGTAVQLFNINVASNVVAGQDRKFVLLSSLDFATTNYVLISTFAATLNAEGFPLPGMGPHKLEIGPNVKLFARKGTATGDTGVCAGSFK